ncbi:MAG: hypothetical protein RDV48_26035, partial [Candidatus Eremiobacteraeota bacterium]|nr:hypothetical protein [Candidatus Eremiobacteraeota bacterium]
FQERIIELENMIESQKKDTEKIRASEGDAGAAAVRFQERIIELENMIESQKKDAEKIRASVEAEGSSASLHAELEEKEELIKYYMEREKQLLEAIQNQQQQLQASSSSESGSGGAGAGYLEKGFTILRKLEHELIKREEFTEALFGRVAKVKETITHLEQELLALPTHEDIDNKIKALMAESSAQLEDLTGVNVSYETILEGIKTTMDKSLALDSKLSGEQEAILLQRKGMVQRFEYLHSNLDNMMKTVKEKEEKLNSARSFFEAKYQEWKAQDEARKKEMENLFGMIS